MKEYILCAAIHLNDGKKYEHQPKNINIGIVVCGRRHHNCFVTLIQFHPKRSIDKPITQGFITSIDRFVGRTAAAQIAFKAGQIPKESHTLVSEDLY